MTVTISDVNGFQEGLIAAGLTAWLGQIDGLKLDCPSQALPLHMQPVAQARVIEALPRAAKHDAVKRKPKPPSPEKSNRKAALAPQDDDKPHVTIRQRICTILRKDGPLACAAILAALVEQGVPKSVDVSQHCYLAKRDGLIAQGEDGRYSAK